MSDVTTPPAEPEWPGHPGAGPPNRPQEQRPAPGQPYPGDRRVASGDRRQSVDAGLYVSAADLRLVLYEHREGVSSQAGWVAAARLASLLGDPCPACGRRGQA